MICLISDVFDEECLTFHVSLIILTNRLDYKFTCNTVTSGLHQPKKVIFGTFIYGVKVGLCFSFRSVQELPQITF